MLFRYRRYLLPGIIVIAALLRLQNIDQPFIDAFAWREASTAMMADNFFRGNWNIFFPEVSWGGPGPNYQGREFQTVTYLAALLYNVFGQHEWVGRSVAVAFGLWGIFALHQLVCRVWDEDRAWIAAAIMAVLPGSVLIERSFLPDSAMVALVTTSLWLLVLFCQTEKWRYFWLAALAGCLGFLTKLPGVILVIPGIYALVMTLGRRALSRRLLPPLVLGAFVVLLPVGLYYLWARHLAVTYPPHQFAGSGKFVWDAGLQSWLAQDYFLPTLLGQLVGTLWTWPGLFLVVLGLLISPNGRRSERGVNSEAASLPWFFHWWMAAMVLRYLIEARHLVMDPYNMHTFNPGAAALIANAVVSLASQLRLPSRPWKLRQIFVGCTIMLIAIFGNDRVQEASRDYYVSQYRLGLSLRGIAAKDDLVVSFGLVPVAIYYSGLKGWVFPPTEVWRSGAGWDYADKDIGLLQSLSSRGAKWVIVAQDNDYTRVGHKEELEEHYPKLADYINNHYCLVQQNEYGAIFRLPPVSTSCGLR